jgi:hypothetical protein
VRADRERSMRVLEEIDRQPEGQMAWHSQRDRIERRIRAAVDRLVAGQIPPSHACEVEALAFEEESPARPSTDLPCRPSPRKTTSFTTPATVA